MHFCGDVFQGSVSLRGEGEASVFDVEVGAYGAEFPKEDIRFELVDVADHVGACEGDVLETLGAEP